MLKALPAERWNYAAAAHLLNRAGFGGPPAEIERLQALGLDQALDWLVDFEKTAEHYPDPEWAKPDSTRVEHLLAARRATPEERRKLQREEQQHQREHLQQLRYWWLRRMSTGTRPLQEKLV